MEDHKQAVKAISDRMRSFYQTKEAYRVYHGSTNSTRNYKIDRAKMVDTSSLNRVLKVDTNTKLATVEPNVPMDKLVEETLKYGLVPPVVMEFPGITVGGGYSGTSGESSSFKYGFFDTTINWVEFVLPDGQIVGASKTEREDLFHGAAGAFGTLGVTTLFELRLIEAKTYVELTYQPWDSSARALAATNEAAIDTDKNDFVDGIIFGKDCGVTLTGRMTDTIDVKTRVQTFSRATDPWFYLHAEQVTRRALKAGATDTVPVIEAIPLRDYLFRYDRGAFWTARYAFRDFATPFNRVTRWALDSLIHTRRMYHALHASGFAQRYIIQDLALPASRAQQFIEWVDEALGIYPLWLCPLQAPVTKSMHPRARPSPYASSSNSKGRSRSSSKLDDGQNDSGEKEQAADEQQDISVPVTTSTLNGTPPPPNSATAATQTEEPGEPLMNIGVWGPCPPSPPSGSSGGGSSNSNSGSNKTEDEYSRFVRTNRQIEAKVHDLGGMKWLYAQAFYTEPEFWRCFDRDWYDGLRGKYGAGHLPNVFDKVRVKVDDGDEGEDGEGDGAGEKGEKGTARREKGRKGKRKSVNRLSGLYGVAHSLVSRDYLLK